MRPVCARHGTALTNGECPWCERVIEAESSLAESDDRDDDWQRGQDDYEKWLDRCMP